MGEVMSGYRSTPSFVSPALIAAGGFGGALLRYGVATILPGLAGTLFVNVSGSLVLGALLHQFVTTRHLTRRTRLLTATGFLSSYTTYSTFAVETATTAAPMWLLANIVLTYGLGFAAAAFSRTLTTAFANGVANR